jgi:hypothetical protein
MAKIKRREGFIRMLISCAALLLFSCVAEAPIIEEYANRATPSLEFPTITSDVATLVTVAPSSSKTLATSSITHDLVKTPTISSKPVTETSLLFDEIPSCENGEAPSSIHDLMNIEGVLVYTDKNRKEWFSLSGIPPRTSKISFPDLEVDTLAYRENPDSLIAYSHNLYDKDSFFRYPVLYIDDGQSQIIELDLSNMNETALRYFSQSVSPLYWSLDWVNAHIVKATVSFGETPESYPNFLYSYFDISKNPPEEIFYVLSNWSKYDWSEISHDLSRVLYIDKQYNIVLWDIEQKKQVSISPSMPFAQVPPAAKWSYDSRFIAFRTLADIGNINILSWDGKIHKTVRNLEFLNSSKNFTSSSGFFRWSPNNHSLAISGDITDESTNSWKPMLFLYDIEKEIYTSQCIFIDDPLYTAPSDILWSPDGNFIASRYSNLIKPPLWLLDLRTGIVYQSEEEYGAIEWISELPEKWYP